MLNNKKISSIVTMLTALIIVSIFGYLIIQNRNRAAEEKRAEQIRLIEQQRIATTISQLSDLSNDKASLLKSVVIGNNGLSITSQEPGTAVVLDTVVLELPGFAVVHNPKAKDDTFVAASLLLQQGVYRLVSIAIPQPLSPNSTYTVSLYADSDTNGVFDGEKDAIISMNEQKLTAEFKTLSKKTLP